MSADQGRDQLAGETAAILAAARTAVTNAGLERRLATAGRRLLGTSTPRDHRAVDALLARAHAEVTRLLTILDTAAADLGDSMDREAARDRFGPVWWERRTASVEQSEAGHPRESAWIRAFAEGLLAERFEVCSRLAVMAWSDDEELRHRVGVSADALDSLRPDAAAAGLRDVVDRPAFAALTSDQRTAIVVFLARISTATGDDRAEARSRVDAATQTATTDAELGALYAVLGELALAEGDTDRAAVEFSYATLRAPDDPAGRIGMGMVDEQRGRWSDAEACYDDAVRTAAEDHRFGRLRAPAPANLYWRLALRLATRHDRLEDALSAIGTAIDMGVTPLGGVTQAKAWRDKGRILERESRAREAAAAFFEAGDLFHQFDDHREKAADLLGRACDLDSSTATHHWLLSDVLRMLANRPDGTLDQTRLGESVQRWHRADPARPDRSSAWAYGGLALATAYLDVPGGSQRAAWWSAAALFERALMLDPRYARGWGLLALVHNEIGNPATALEAAERALSEDPDELVGLEQQCAALTSLNQVPRAREALARRLEQSDEGPVRYQDVYLRLLDNDVDGALAVLDAMPVDERVSDRRFMLALCHDRAGDDAAAVEQYRQILDDARRTATGDPDGWERDPQIRWSAYATGEYDLAERLIRAALDGDPVWRSRVWTSLGLVLLGRGDPDRDDLGRGEDALATGIDLVADVDTLIWLDEVDLPRLGALVRRLPHNAAVAAALDRLRGRLAHRWSEVGVGHVEEMRRAGAETGASAAPAGIAAGAVLARTAADRGEHREAIDRYRALAGDVVEARSGVLSAVNSLLAEADRRVSMGEVAAASETYESLRLVLEGLGVAGGPAEGESELSARESLAAYVGLLTKAALAAIELGDTTRMRRRMALAWNLVHGRGAVVPEVEHLARLFARDVATFWRQHDAIVALRDEPGVAAGAVTLLNSMLAKLSLDRIYRTSRDDVDQTTRFPLINPVLDLHDELVPPDPDGGWNLLTELLPAMRRNIEAGTGVIAPGIRVRSVPDLRRREYRITIEDVELGRGIIAPDGPGDAELRPAVHHLEQLLRANLSRIFGPDEVADWAADAGPATLAQPRVAALLDSREGRLRLHRLLRMLLREQIPLTDRDPVLMAAADALAETPGDPVAALTVVRLRLAARIPAWRQVDALLPQELEDVLAAGLTNAAGEETGLSTWELDIGPTVELVEQVHEWLHTAGDAGGVVVRSPAVRLFLWRLMSTLPERVTVITADERAAALGLVPSVATGNGSAR